MPNINDIKYFKERLYNLNAQIIKVEKKISQQSDRLVCEAHTEEVEKLITNQDQLTRIDDRIKQNKWRHKSKQTSPLYKYFLKKA